MNLNYVCKFDEAVFQTIAYGSDAHLLGIWIRCPRCQTEITLHDLIPSTYTVVRLNPQELYKASQGNGLPTEKDLSEENIRRLITEGFVVAIDLEDPTDQRIILNSLTVKYQERTMRLFLGASTKGAAIYKITEVGIDNVATKPNT